MPRTEQNEGVNMVIIAELKTDDGKLLAVMTLPPKDFKTGSKGFFANGKLEVEGKRYQAQIQLVEIGSKKAGENPEK
jgi:predicted RNA-binding protein with EMAP domain